MTTHTVIIETRTAQRLHDEIVHTINDYASRGEEVIRERIQGTGGSKGFRAELTFRRKE